MAAARDDTGVASRPLRWRAVGRAVVGLAVVLAGAAAAADAPAYRRSVATYAVPDVALVNQDGAPVALPALLSGDAPVVLSFVFTTCPTVCPVTTATLARMRDVLGADGAGLRLVTMTIDPDHDRPQVLADYAARHHTGAGWQFVTGSPADVERVLKAFDAGAGDKMRHRPVVLLRAAGQSEWVRIDGLASAADLAREYRRLGGG
jgi:protein SCO1/2